MTRFSWIKPALIACTALGLSGCVNLLPETVPSAIYRLSAPEAVARETGAELTLVQVDPPHAPRALSGTDIAILMDGRHIAFMSGAQWIAPAPRVMQTLMIDAMNAQHGEVMPARPEDGARVDYELRTELREFEAAYLDGMQSAPTIRVRISARLIDERARNIAATQEFTAEVRAGENRQRAIIDAFDRAAGQATRDMAAWVAEMTAD